MTISDIKQELSTLPADALEEVQAYITLLLKDQNDEETDWARNATNAITEEEWRSMEAELKAVRSGDVRAVSLHEAIKTIKS